MFSQNPSAKFRLLAMAATAKTKENVEEPKDEDSSGPQGAEEATDLDVEARGSNARKKSATTVVYLSHLNKNWLNQIRDRIAMSDVFITRGENPPFIGSLQIGVWFIPILLVLCLWDTLAVTVFEIPHLCTINLPGFLLGWHFLMMMLAMYGFMLSYLSSGNSPRTKLGGISLGIHYVLLFYRAFMEIYFDGYRGQWKLYYEKTEKIF